MRAIMFAMCIVMVARFVYNIQRVTNADGWKWFIKSSFDAFLIIGFAILEKGRW